MKIYFVEKLRDLRITSGKTQAIVAEDLGISRSAYANYESGMSRPNYEMLYQIARYFNVSVDYLINDKEFN